MAMLVVLADRLEVRQTKTLEIDPGPLNPVVEPQGNSVALDQFKEALKKGLLQRVSRGGAVRVGSAPLFLRELPVAVVAVSRRVVFALIGGQGPERRPVDLL